jgi:hypothetical protein
LLASALVVLVCIGAGCGGSPVEQSLLSGLEPQSSNFEDPARLTDGRVPRDGSPWQGDTAVGRGPSFAEFDLGRPRDITAAWIQGDHNDTYILSVSTDGEEFQEIWRADPVRSGGLRARHARDLDARGRFVRVEAEGGDGAYSIGELLLFEQRPRVWPPAVPRLHPAPPHPRVRLWLAVAAALAALWILLLPKAVPFGWLAGSALVPVAALIGAVHSVLEAWPLDVVGFGAVRGASAVVGAAAVLRLCREAHRRVQRACIVLFALAAAVAAGSFFHFGRPQFHHAGEARPTYVHQYDMRVYFPQGKYFDELGFDGVYAASVEALADGPGRGRRARFGSDVIRDLRTHAVVRIRDAQEHLAEVRGRFDAARWDTFVEDMRYFWESMGTHGYLRSMLDHGGNATPVWLANAKLLFSGLTATDETLTRLSLLDPLLLALAFLCVGRVFGVLPALVCLLVFGANDFHMGGGTNWSGATLRHDWLAALLAGMAALGARRFILAGVLLGTATMLRAFPALTFAGIAVSFVWAAWDGMRRGTLREATRPHVIVAVAAGATMAALAAYSAHVLSASAWPAWLHKVKLLSGEAHPNHISLKLLFSFDPLASFQAAEERGVGPDWQTTQAATFARRAVVFYPTAVGITAVVAWACRGASMHRAALLGLLLVVVWLYPANYYLHFFCVVPLIACEGATPFGTERFRPVAAVWVSLLALCAGQYFTVATPHLDVHYVQAAWITFVAMGGILVGVIWSQVLARRGAAA